MLVVLSIVFFRLFVCFKTAVLAKAKLIPNWLTRLSPTCSWNFNGISVNKIRSAKEYKNSHRTGSSFACINQVWDTMQAAQIKQNIQKLTFQNAVH